MFKRNLMTAFIAVSSAALLYGGMTFAREQQARDDRVPQVVASQKIDDNGGLRETAEPIETAEPTETAEPDESFDDHGNDPAETAEPVETFDDHGGNGGGTDDSTVPTASPDDKGGSSGSGGSDDSVPAPSASPDDNGGHGSDG